MTKFNSYRNSLACLTDKPGLTAVDIFQEDLQTFGFDKNVVVSSHKPLKLVTIVFVHVFEHHE
jgi:hypothetical protein